MKKINTYQKYLENRETLTITKMEALHREILEELGCDEDALEIYGILLRKATDYAHFRAEWPMMTRETKMEKDSSRTSCHDSLITNFNMLARYLKMQGKKAQWRETLGNEAEDPYCRKKIGDFGCYLVFVNSICAR